MFDHRTHRGGGFLFFVCSELFFLVGGMGGWVMKVIIIAVHLLFVAPIIALETSVFSLGHTLG